MTVAVAVTVHDGVMLAADSAGAIPTVTATGEVQGIAYLYNTANKLLNVYKGLPIAMVSWGAGAIGHRSMSTLFKDLRRRLMGRDSPHEDWALEQSDYALKGVAERAREFIFEEIFRPVYSETGGEWFLGILIAGYSANEDLAELSQLSIHNGECVGPEPVNQKGEPGIIWRGDGDAIHRLVLGFGARINAVFQELGMQDSEIQHAIQKARQILGAPLVPAAMPIQDAIDLAAFLAETEAGFSRFTPGAQTVGGPIEIAAITKHEGFKWIKRKFFFDAKYNPIQDLGDWLNQGSQRS